MKHCIKTIALFMLLAFSINAKAQTQDGMQKWMEYMTPSDVHAMIAKSDGNWDEEVSMFMSPDAPPMQMKSSCTNKMIMGGRYQESVHTGDFNGMPFEGKSILAYDNLLKTLYMTWIDNMGTGLISMEGKWDEASKSVTFTGKMTDPMAGKVIDIKQVWKWVDDNTQEVDQYAVKDGKDVKSMHIKLTRKK